MATTTRQEGKDASDEEMARLLWVPLALLLSWNLHQEAYCKLLKAWKAGSPESEADDLGRLLAESPHEEWQKDKKELALYGSLIFFLSQCCVYF